ncbi:hypothetical protein [Krasilnikoviella flava]|uniref:Uncharacterized protein n=1 Tax=Krasilnikoviella flava TaxID=526729 RepID=A0A1T5IAD6_9MICO|nr:hypothetical protein [Krasilnikoviella flava]SKC35998.1 hypothetical protein SAMN04324258_0229 [Krasilnikoviella flava]
MTAFVESPLQLLCAVEAHAAGHAGTSTRVLARADVPALTAGIDAVRALGLPSGLDVQPAPAPRRLPDDVVVVGDPFSGAFQAALLRTPRPPQHLVVVDDGLATLDLARRVLTGTPLVRLTAPPDPLRYGLGALAGRRLHRLVAGGRLTLCTTIPLDDDTVAGLRGLGVDVRPHDFAWLRSRPQRNAPQESTVVVGSALVADGLVHADRYAAWVRGIASDGPVRYVPHRRHDPLVSALLERLPGVVVDEPGAPVEIRLRGLRPGQRTVMLPSTSAVTLSRLLAPRGVVVAPHAVPDAWWTDRATPELRRHLGRTHALATRAAAESAGAARTAHVPGRSSTPPRGLPAAVVSPA